MNCISVNFFVFDPKTSSYFTTSQENFRKMSTHIFVGPVVHWNTESNSIEYLDRCTITVTDGTITGIIPKEELLAVDETRSTPTLHVLGPNQFLIPGFVDAHVHAPQYPNLGLGADLPLLQWLKTYIFSLESKFKDLAFAEKVYGRVVDRMLSCGTTTASYFGTIHTDACLLLADIINSKGQRAFVGKVNMTVNCDEDYGENVAESLAETERFVQTMNKKQYPHVEPIITPRFAVTCDMDTLTRLGKLASKYNLRVQTHLSENQTEIDTVKEMNPGCRNYTEVYQRAGLLTKQTILAHSIHLTQEEMQLLARTESSVVHCPSSNCFLQSGVCDTVKLLEEKVNIGLGTDMGAGYSPSILEVARRSLEVSSVLTSSRRDGIDHEFSTGQAKVSKVPLRKPLKFNQAFYFATMGGAKALNLEDKIGNFSRGKMFDALLINLDSPYSPVEFHRGLTLEEKFAKFFFTGDDRNVEKVYVDGRLVVDKTTK